MRRSLASQQQNVSAATSSTATELAVVQRELKDVQATPTDSLTEEEDVDMDAAITNTTSLVEALVLSRKLLQGLSSKIEAFEASAAAAVGETTNITFGTNYQGMQMGNNHGSITWNSRG